MVVICTSLFAKNENARLDTVSIKLCYYHQFQFAGFYIAQEKGFYRDAGLYVNILEHGGVNILHTVTSGKSEYGVLGSGLIGDKLLGESVVLLKAIYQHSAYAIFTLKKNNIRTPSDLIDKKLMIKTRYLEPKILSMFKSENVSLDEIILVRHSFKYDDLISGKVDAATGHLTTQPFYLESRGYESISIKPTDYGIDFYGDMLFTSENEIKKHPKRTDAFIEASMKGWRYAYENIDEAIDIILKLNSKRPYKLTKEMLISEAEISKKYVLPNIVEIGYVNPERIKKIEKKYKELYSYKNSISIDDFIYNKNINYSNIDVKIFFFVSAIAIFITLISLWVVALLRVRLKRKSFNLETETLEKKNTENRLKKEELAKQAMLNASPDLMFRVSKDGVYLEVNIPLGNELGIIKQDVIGKKIEEIMPLEVAHSAHAVIKKSLSTREIQFLEYKMSHNNLENDFEARIIPSGKNEVLVIVRDITEIKNKTNRLKKSEEKFHKIFHNSPDSIVLTNLIDSVILDCNKSFLVVSGFKYDEVIGKTPVEIGIWANLDDRTRFLNELYINKSISAAKYNFKKKSGTIINALVSAEIITIDSKEVVLGTYRDITELVQKERLLKESQLKFSKVFKSSPIPIAISSLEEGRVFDINTKTEEFMNSTADEIIGKTMLELKFWKSESDREAYVNKLMEEGYIKDFEISFKNPNGENVPCSVSSEIIEINKEKYIIGSLVDLSTIKKNELELKKTLKVVESLKAKLHKENILLKQEINANYNIGNIITNSPLVQKELLKIQKVASTNATVLITGETGTGKELFSRTIHSFSSRADKPLVKVNCAALPTNLIESELFGHERGAFTGAVKEHVGRFELANKATIFLDEIGELPLDVQVKLLRVLQEGEFERVGSTKTRYTDARIIAASNRNLQKMIEDGTFREDLFYRLNVFPINTIPLRERKEDIEPLVNGFIKQISARIGKKISSVEKNSFNLLVEYSFPGNIRELQNIIEQAIITTNNTVLSFDIPSEKQNHKKASKKKGKVVLEKEMIVEVLNSSEWKIEGEKGAAKRLGVPPSTLRDQIKKYNLTKPI